MRFERLTGARGVLVLLAGSLLAAACGAGATPNGGSQGTPVAGGTMTFRMTGDFRNFDVSATVDAVSQFAVSAAYSTLLYQDNSGKLQGYMAKSFKATPTSVTFNLKPGMTCADGTPVTATVVKNSFQLLIDRKAQYNSVLFGPGPYTLTADDATGTFTFGVAQPFADLAFGFTQAFPANTSGIVCPAGVRDPSQLATRMFGAGPYTLSEAIHGDHVTMKLRPEFKWGPFGTTAKTVGVPETVIIKPIPNETTAANALLTGAIDAIADAGALTGPDVSRLLADPTLKHFERPSYAMRMLVMNQSAGHIGTDPIIRKALLTAVDPKAWLAAADDGHGRLSPSFITTDTLCYDPKMAQLAPKPNIQAAQKILTDNGWTLSNGKLSQKGQPLKFTFNGDVTFNAGPEYLVTQWTQMGADVILSNPDHTTYATTLITGKYDVSVISTSTPGPFMGPVSKRISGPLPPVGTNYTFGRDAILDQEAAAAESTLGAESCKHWANFQQELWHSSILMGLDAPFSENFSRNVDFSLGTIPIMVRRVK